MNGMEKLLALKTRRAKMFASGMSINDVIEIEGTTRQAMVAYICRNFIEYTRDMEAVRMACEKFLQGPTPPVTKPLEIIMQSVARKRKQEIKGHTGCKYFVAKQMDYCGAVKHKGGYCAEHLDATHPAGAGHLDKVLSVKVRLSERPPN